MGSPELLAPGIPIINAARNPASILLATCPKYRDTVTNIQRDRMFTVDYPAIDVPEQTWAQLPGGVKQKVPKINRRRDLCNIRQFCFCSR